MTDYIAGHYVLQALHTKAVPPDFNELLKLYGVSNEELSKPESLVPVELVEALLKAIPVDPALIGIYSANQVQLTTQGSLSLLLMTAGTIRDAMALLVQFSGLLTSAISFRLEEDEQAGYLFMTPNSMHKAFNLMFVFYVGTAIQRLAMLATGDAPELVIEVTGPRPDVLLNDDRYDPPRWQFHASSHCVVLPLSFLNLAGRFSDPVAHTLAKVSCEAAFDVSRTHRRMTERVRSLLTDSLAYPSQDLVAEKLNMSLSTFKRRLSCESTNFGNILQECRRQRAILLLRRQELSLQTISERLGYADATNFIHAFKKWTGMTPNHYRKDRL